MYLHTCLLLTYIVDHRKTSEIFAVVSLASPTLERVWLAGLVTRRFYGAKYMHADSVSCVPPLIIHVVLRSVRNLYAGDHTVEIESIHNQNKWTTKLTGLDSGYI